MTVSRDRSILQPVAKTETEPRKDWAAAFQQMARDGGDDLLVDSSIDANLKDWSW